MTSPFSVQLVIYVSSLTVSSHWRNRRTNSVNWLIWRSGFIIAILSLLALLVFFSIKSREWSTAQLASCTKLRNLPTSFISLWSPLAADQQPDSIQNSSHLFPNCLWCNSSISLWVASSLFPFSFSSFSLRYSDFPCLEGVQEDSWGQILSVYRTCHLELSSFLCQACHVTLLFQFKTENPPLLFCPLIYRFLSSVSIKPKTSMLVFFAGCVWVRVCVGGGLCVFWSESAYLRSASNLGSHEIGRHKLHIIFIIMKLHISAFFFFVLFFFLGGGLHRITERTRVSV